MKPTFEAFKSACPEVDERFLKAHLSRLGERYFRSFSEKQFYRHVKGLSGISPENPIEIILDPISSAIDQCHANDLRFSGGPFPARDVF